MKIEVHRHEAAKPWTYAMLDLRQRAIAREVLEGGEGACLLSELAPVVTLGRRAPEGDLSRPLLAKAGIEVFPTDRGGLATYHGPGLWVLFLVDRLERLTGDPRGVRKSVSLLLGIAAEVGRSYGRKASVGEGARLGVWDEYGKFAALGVHVHRGVLLHGIAINGFRTEQSFVGIRPCGLELPVSFLLNNREDESFRELGQRILRATQAAISRSQIDAPTEFRLYPESRSHL